MNYRIDIQALRGLAVLLVVFYHAKLVSIPGGYLGVDIFFVISGFLITNQIVKAMLAGSFSFKEFYLRRAWRLLPAVYVVLALCCLAAPLLLTNRELHDFTYQLIGSVTFSANIALWLQTGYFEVAAELKPLLHMWSLSIEEQYYLILPAVLFIFNKKRWVLIISTLTILSLLLMIFMSKASPGAVFYLTPTRVWELGIGSMLALYQIRNKHALPQFLGHIAFLLFFVLSLKPIESTQFIAINNLIITIATAIVINSRLKILNSNIALKTLGSIGLISYSLYLVHWPIIAFLNSASIDENGPDFILRLLSVLLSFVLAITLFTLVEKKWRITTNSTQRKNKSTVLLVLITPVILLFFTWSTNQNRVSINPFPKQAINIGLNFKCQNESSLFNDLCKTTTSPSMFIWGDSFAMHLIPALQASPQAHFQQATRSSCGPYLKTAYFHATKHNVASGIECLSFNHSVLNYILESQTIKTVVLASPWSPLLQGNLYLTKTNNDFEIRKKKKDIVIQELIALISTLKSNGKKVILVAPPPSSGFDSRKCHERDTLNLIRLGGTDDCHLHFEEVLKHQQKANQLFDLLKERSIATYDFKKKLCDKEVCITTLNNTVLYNDGGHLSIDGSEVYGNKYDLYKDLLLLAN